MKPRTRAESATDVYRCGECGAAADYGVDSREVKTSILTISGIDHVSQHHDRRYLCAGCAFDAMQSDDPPMHIEILPAHAAARDREAAKARKDAVKRMTDAQLRLGEDWGRRGP